MQAMGPTILEGSQFGLRDMILAAIVIFFSNKAGYTATPVTCRWEGAMFEVT